MSDPKNRIAEIERQIEMLPKGSIGKKTINGKIYYYHRWQENKRRKEKYIPLDEVEAIRQRIGRRRDLESELKDLKRVAEFMKAGGSSPPAVGRSRGDEDEIPANVLTGEDLRVFARAAGRLSERRLTAEIRRYLFEDGSEKVCVLYGLRRTGKTTMVRQVISGMDEEQLQRSAFMQMTYADTLADLNAALRALQRRGYRYVFIDEATNMADFIEGAALLPDIFCAGGMRIVVSGTDSLGFIFAEDAQLYDRCVLLHTTFIPYREFSKVLGISGIDEYIRYGGTMSLGGANYNEITTFADERAVSEYIDSSIARNIQHSLECYRQGAHFRALRELYDKDELTSAVNRVIEDMNHRFTVDTLTRRFRSNDLAVSASNLRRDRQDPTDVLDRIDTDEVTKRLADLLEIREKEDMKVRVEETHAAEIKEYLDLLDLTVEIDVVDMSDVGRVRKRTAVSQPGLRYCQAEALVSSLLLDSEFADLSIAERGRVMERIRSEVKGRMMEDIVLLETKAAFPEKQVFTLQFPVGEIDMVIFDPDDASCELYEIKHSRERAEEQSRHLRDEKKNKDIEFRFGEVKGRYVLYRGENAEEYGIRYINVEDYLNGLSDGSDLQKRTERNISQKELSELISNGQTDIETLKRIAKAAGKKLVIKLE